MLKNQDNIKIENKEEVIKILWECCQIPDFSKKAYGQHIEVVKKVFSFLNSRKNRVPNDYMKEQLKGLDKYSGNIDALANRISNIRTWSYVANKKNWVENQDYWIEVTKSIEDKLSDQLHEELTRSFIDKRISILSRSLKQDIALGTKISNENEVTIDGQFIGKLNGLKLNLDFKSGSLDTDLKSLRKAARQGIAPELMRRVSKILKGEFLKLHDDHKIYWRDSVIAILQPGKDYLNPKISLTVDEATDLESKEKLQSFLDNWIYNLIRNELADLVNLKDTNTKNSYARALCFRLFENNGIIKRDLINQITKNLPKDERLFLRKKGIKMGRYHIFLPKMLKPSAVTLRITLWKIFFQDSRLTILPKFGLNFLKSNKINDKKFLLICGFESFDKFYIRVDILEKLFIKIIETSKNGKFKVSSDMINLVGCTKENFNQLLKLMGYKHEKNKDKDQFDDLFTYLPKKSFKRIKKINTQPKNDNPFKILSEVRFK